MGNGPFSLNIITEHRGVYNTGHAESNNCNDLSKHPRKEKKTSPLIQSAVAPSPKTE